MPLELETNRLLMREWKMSDWKEAHEYAVHPEVSRYMIWGPNSEKETKEFIRLVVDCSRDNPRTMFEMAMVLKEKTKIIGGVGLRIMGPNDSTAMIGYVLHQDFWGQGFTTEAVLSLMNFGFGKLCLHRIYATCDTENIGSERVMQKCGMRREGHFVQDMLIKGRWRDSYLYAILESEFKASQK